MLQNGFNALWSCMVGDAAGELDGSEWRKSALDECY
jgi:hypothetical protein